MDKHLTMNETEANEAAQAVELFGKLTAEQQTEVIEAMKKLLLDQQTQKH